MRKYGILIAALLAVAICGVGTVHFVINSNQQEVTIEEITLTGDRELANGIEVTSKYTIDSDWQVQYDLTKKEVTHVEKTESDYMINRDDASIFLHPVILNYHYTTDNASFIFKYAAEIEYYTGVPKEDFFHAIDSAESGKKTTYNFYLQDYVEHLPFHLFISGIDISLDTTDLYRNMDLSVPKEAKLVLEVEKNNDGIINDWKLYTSYDSVYIESEGVIDEDWIYMAVTGIGKKEEIIVSEDDDTSEILAEHYFDAGTSFHGIHQIPFTASTQKGWADLNQANLIYSIEPNESVIHLENSFDKKDLLLFTQKNDDLYLSVIDKANFQCKQKLKLPKNMINIRGTIKKDNCLFVLDGKNQFTGFSLSDGTFHQELTDKLDVAPERMGNLDVDFDGSRFALTHYTKDNIDNKIQPVYYIWIYKGSSICYHGAFLCSISHPDSRATHISYYGNVISLDFKTLN